MPKSRRILSERVAAVVARGEAEIGFQQISEIIGIPGAELVGPLPARCSRSRSALSDREGRMKPVVGTFRPTRDNAKQLKKAESTGSED